MGYELDLGPEKRRCATKGCKGTFMALRGTHRMFCDECILARVRPGKAMTERIAKRLKKDLAVKV